MGKDNLLIVLSLVALVLALLVQPELAKLPVVGTFAGLLVAVVAAFEAYKLSQAKSTFSFAFPKGIGMLTVFAAFAIIALNGLMPLVGMANPLGLPAAGLAGVALILGLF